MDREEVQLPLIECWREVHFAEDLPGYPWVGEMALEPIDAFCSIERTCSHVHGVEFELTYTAVTKKWW